MTYLQSLINAPDKAAVAEANFAKLDTQLLRGTATLDFPNVLAQAAQDLTIAVVGAAVGDPVILGTPAPDIGIVFSAWVSAADVVTVRATNVTGGGINPAGGTFRVMVVRY